MYTFRWPLWIIYCFCLIIIKELNICLMYPHLYPSWTNILFLNIMVPITHYYSYKNTHQLQDSPRSVCLGESSSSYWCTPSCWPHRPPCCSWLHPDYMSYCISALWFSTSTNNWAYMSHKAALITTQVQLLWIRVKLWMVLEIQILGWLRR